MNIWIIDVIEIDRTIMNVSIDVIITIIDRRTIIRTNETTIDRTTMINKRTIDRERERRRKENDGTIIDRRTMNIWIDGEWIDDDGIIDNECR